MGNKVDDEWLERYERAQRGILRHLVARNGRGDGELFLQELRYELQPSPAQPVGDDDGGRGSSAALPPGSNSSRGSQVRAGYHKRSGQMDHLTCFTPGMLALAWHHDVGGGGRELLTTAESLMATCYAMYTAWPSRLAPEITFFDIDGGLTAGELKPTLDRPSPHSPSPGMASAHHRGTAPSNACHHPTPASNACHLAPASTCACARRRARSTARARTHRWWWHRFGCQGGAARADACQARRRPLPAPP